MTLLVTFPAGGPTDIAGRALAEATSKYLGQTVVVENRPGATGTLGAAALVNARPDGHTVSMIPITVLRLPHMENVAYDPMKDITYVMGVSGYVFAHVVRADAPWKSMGELIAAARAKPGEISYGSHGIGGTVPRVAAGKARVLAVMTEKRAAVWPDAPTLTELGYGIVSTSPYGIGAPAATPPAVVKTLHDAFKKGLEDPIHTKTLEEIQPAGLVSLDRGLHQLGARAIREGAQDHRRPRAGEEEMSARRIGVVMHGVTGRMGANQHVVRSIV